VKRDEKISSGEGGALVSLQCELIMLWVMG
jgi:hypothetical protein